MNSLHYQVLWCRACSSNKPKTKLFFVVLHALFHLLVKIIRDTQFGTSLGNAKLDILFQIGLITKETAADAGAVRRGHGYWFPERCIDDSRRLAAAPSGCSAGTARARYIVPQDLRERLLGQGGDLCQNNEEQLSLPWQADTIYPNQRRTGNKYLRNNPMLMFQRKCGKDHQRIPFPAALL